MLPGVPSTKTLTYPEGPAFQVRVGILGPPTGPGVPVPLNGRHGRTVHGARRSRHDVVCPGRRASCDVPLGVQRSWTTVLCLDKSSILLLLPLIFTSRSWATISPKVDLDLFGFRRRRRGCTVYVCIPTLGVVVVVVVAGLVQRRGSFVREWVASGQSM